MRHSIRDSPKPVMSLNQILYSSEDAYGPIMVSDDGECRTLSFALNDEQSRCLKAAPHILQYDYTQAMLMVLIFCQPKRVLALGLGGGSLVTALYHTQPKVDITAVELRAAVIEVAKRYFYLPQGKRLTVIQQDADEYLLSDALHKQDIIFADLYHAEGIDGVQLRDDFLARCAALLKPEGWLVLNYWYEFSDDLYLRESLHAHFADVRTVMTGSKNWVILAGKTPVLQTAREMKDKAARLSENLGFSLARSLARLRALGE